MLSQADNIEICQAKNQEHIRSCYALMLQLRPHLKTQEEFITQVLHQMQEGYLLAYLQENGAVRSLAGFRILTFLAWGKVLYIDDLVSDEAARKHGHASKVLQYVIDRAKEAHCDEVHLDSGPQRHDAHRLYLNHGFKIIGHHFALDMKSLKGIP